MIDQQLNDQGITGEGTTIMYYDAPSTFHDTAVTSVGIDAAPDAEHIVYGEDYGAAGIGVGGNPQGSTVPVTGDDYKAVAAYNLNTTADNIDEIRMVGDGDLNADGEITADEQAMVNNSADVPEGGIVNDDGTLGVDDLDPGDAPEGGMVDSDGMPGVGAIDTGGAPAVDGENNIDVLNMSIGITNAEFVNYIKLDVDVQNEDGTYVSQGFRDEMGITDDMSEAEVYAAINTWVEDEMMADEAVVAAQQNLSDATQRAEDDGIFIVASAGNSGGLAQQIYDATDGEVIVDTKNHLDTDNVMLVGSSAVDLTPSVKDDNVEAWFSSEGELYAPGEQVEVMTDGHQPGSQTQTLQNGTSFSAPHVAGIAAGMKQANPDLTPAEIREIMNSTAIEGADGTMQLDEASAVNMALEQAGKAPLDYVVPDMTSTEQDTFGMQQVNATHSDDTINIDGANYANSGFTATLPDIPFLVTVDGNVGNDTINMDNVTTDTQTIISDTDGTNNVNVNVADGNQDMSVQNTEVDNLNMTFGGSGNNNVTFAGVTRNDMDDDKSFNHVDFSANTGANKVYISEDSFDAIDSVSFSDEADAEGVEDDTIVLNGANYEVSTLPDGTQVVTDTVTGKRLMVQGGVLIEIQTPQQEEDQQQVA